MNIPKEFAGYMVTESHLSPGEQYERSVNMYKTEIKERASLLRNLKFEKETVKKRIKKYIEWGFEFFELPNFYKSVDSIVDEVYSK